MEQSSSFIPKQSLPYIISGTFVGIAIIILAMIVQFKLTYLMFPLVCNLVMSALCYIIGEKIEGGKQI